jgi:hypothetical protein
VFEALYNIYYKTTHFKKMPRGAHGKKTRKMIRAVQNGNSSKHNSSSIHNSNGIKYGKGVLKVSNDTFNIKKLVVDGDEYYIHYVITEDLKIDIKCICQSKKHNSKMKLDEISEEQKILFIKKHKYKILSSMGWI